MDRSLPWDIIPGSQKHPQGRLQSRRRPGLRELPKFEPSDQTGEGGEGNLLLPIPKDSRGLRQVEQIHVPPSVQSQPPQTQNR